MSKPKLIVSRRWPDAVEAQLAKHYDVQLNTSDVAFEKSDFVSALESCDALLTTVTDKLDASVFKELNTNNVKTRVIGNYGVGYSHIDLPAAQSLGIAVTNTPDVLSECTADIAIMLMLMCARRAGEGERELRAGEWSGWRPTHMVGNKVSGARLGIIGFGRIGREVARRARGFGMSVILHNRSRVDDTVLQEFDAVQMDTLEGVMANSDFVSLHCPGGSENTHLINSDMLSLMKPNAYLINTARGEVVEEEALVASLRTNKIAGAGLDVFQNEPNINPDIVASPNVVLLPHLGSATTSTREAMGFRVLKNLDQFFSGATPQDLVS